MSEITKKNKDPLHGITLQTMLEYLHSQLGWQILGEKINIKCFQIDPSIKSSLTFLRKTPWARTKVESLYLWALRQEAKTIKLDVE
jgi:uncharacterized protein (DUF2132 family)